MSVYQQMIRDIFAAAGREDRADEQTAAVVEEVMRSSFTSLDWMTPGEFRFRVFEALADVDLLAADGLLGFWCEQNDVTVPAWATA